MQAHSAVQPQAPGTSKWMCLSSWRSSSARSCHIHTMLLIPDVAPVSTMAVRACCRSGMCFMSGGAAAAPAVALQQSQHARSQPPASFKPPGHPGHQDTRTAGAAPKAATPLHDPNIPGSLVLNLQQWQGSKVRP